MGALDGLVSVARSLHGTFGRPVTLRRVTPGTFDPATNSVSETTADETVRAVFDAFRADELVGPIQAGDLKATVAVADEPTTKDRVIDGGREYAVVWVGKQYATEQVAYYTLALRR